MWERAVDTAWLSVMAVSDCPFLCLWLHACVTMLFLLCAFLPISSLVANWVHHLLVCKSVFYLPWGFHSIPGTIYLFALLLTFKPVTGREPEVCLAPFELFICHAFFHPIQPDSLPWNHTGLTSTSTLSCPLFPLAEVLSQNSTFFNQ